MKSPRKSIDSIKKKHEKEILFTIYKKELIEKDLTDNNETPDFIITDPNNQLKIGVEITRLFQSQSSAAQRSAVFSNNFINRNKPGAKKRKNKPYLSKTHAVKLESDIAVGPIQPDYVILEEVSLKDYLDFFEELISKKNKSYINKIADIEFTNLFAYEIDNLPKSLDIKVTDLYNVFRSHAIFNEIINSSFQEIILFTKLKTGNYSLPLKWLIFTNEFYLYRNFWKNELQIPQPKKDDFILMLKHFCVAMHFLGFEKVYLAFDKNNKRIIVFGNTYWELSDERITKEKSFLALKLKDEWLIPNIIPKHINESSAHHQYFKYRLKLAPVLKEGMFFKQNRSE